MAAIKRFRLCRARPWGDETGEWLAAPPLGGLASSPAYWRGIQDGRDILEYDLGWACWLEVEMEPPLKPYQRWRHPPGCPDADWCSGNGVCHWDCQGSDDTCL